MTRRIAIFLSCLAFSSAALAQEVVFGHAVRVGGDIEISQPVNGPLRVVGGEVKINAPVDGNVQVAGGEIGIGKDSVISGSASLAGGSIEVKGSIKQGLRVAGGEITVNGPVGGDVSVAGGTLALGPDARIGGKVTFHGGELTRDPGAQVAGAVEHVRGRWNVHHRTVAERFVHGWLWTAGLMVFAALLAAALPGVSDHMAQELRERPWLTPLLGLLALTSIPIAAVLMMITVIGIPIGVLALLSYVVLLLVGYVWLAVVVGGLLVERIKPETAALTAWRAGAAMLTMLVLGVLVRVPFVGGLFRLAAVVMGVGMIVALVFRRSHPAESVAA